MGAEGGRGSGWGWGWGVKKAEGRKGTSGGSPSQPNHQDR